MKLTPMMALPVATLMMLLSSTFVRLPGNTATEIVYPRTDLPQQTSVDKPEAATLDYQQEIGNRGALRSRDIRSGVVAFDLFDAWDVSEANDMVDSRYRVNDSIHVSRREGNHIDLISAGHPIAMKGNFIRSRHPSRR